jgi:rRNA processing protein Gar1
VFNFSPKGSIVVKATMTPRIGNVVCDKMGRPLGKVIRITGPVEAPYVLVTSMAKDEISMFRLSGKQVFIDDTYQQRPARDRRPRAKGPAPEKRTPGSKNHRSKDRREFRPKVKRPAGGKRKDRR